MNNTLFTIAGILFLVLLPVLVWGGIKLASAGTMMQPVYALVTFATAAIIVACGFILSYLAGKEKK